MSFCAVHMAKNGMSAVGGLQSHNQREHESTKNKDINYDLSKYNYDCINPEPINYRRVIKDRIESLDLKKAVRKDAVTYCSFIISSDRQFFYDMAKKQYGIDCAEAESERTWYSPSSTSMLPRDYEEQFDYLSDDKKTEYVLECSKPFFECATQFFQQRYGKENVINATVHLDEKGAPHMHLGLVPVTEDGRLSAKSIFTKQELRELQTDFADTIGVIFGLERGIEGSKRKHLDELDFKIKKATETLDKTNTAISASKHELLKVLEEVKEAKREKEKAERCIPHVLQRIPKKAAEQFVDAWNNPDVVYKGSAVSIERARRREEMERERESRDDGWELE